MTRHFSAFPLPDPVADHLAAALDALDVRPPLRRTPREQWHVTVGYYGAEDPHARLASLREKVAGLRAPRLRLRGSGTFASVALLVVRDSTGALEPLAEAADFAVGGHPAYSPHVTVATWSRREDRGPGERLAADLVDYSGPWWSPSALVLYASEDGRYTPVDQVGLRAPG
ncbi:2'-5' RNA ligase family protein [Actinokineospora bangkokensis]|uniref:2'-5' RNA ligase n=1 Tax=Actinokineospora bangkokensis TaxID=1193682 RepID=A0A1Q9LQ29_9PSEU|nr:2'-5' RNA ligase family protein [Actinokineospora bangkokensis]OLR94138.1 hypothetical protein BJP25_10005 [Actinokineospora bangkokensis]